MSEQTSDAAAPAVATSANTVPANVIQLTPADLAALVQNEVAKAVANIKPPQPGSAPIDYHAGAPSHALEVGDGVFYSVKTGPAAGQLRPAIVTRVYPQVGEDPGPMEKDANGNFLMTDAHKAWQRGHKGLDLEVFGLLGSEKFVSLAVEGTAPGTWRKRA